jgi:low temperature requirement protein LtrA
MGSYFKDIIKPKWYIWVLFTVTFIFQCLAVINLCAQFGGGYYVIIPIQLIIGYLNVLMYLMVQKDSGRKDFVYTAIISVVLGVGAAFLIFDGLYTSVPGLKGIVYGILMQISIAMAFYAAIQIGKLMIIKIKTKKTAESMAEGD